MQEPIPVSICVAARNRIEQIKVAFPTWVAACPAEIVIIDDGSTDGTGDYVRQMQAVLRNAVEIVYELRTGPDATNYKGNPGAVHNRSIEISGQEIVILTCAEVAFLPGCVAAMVERLDQPKPPVDFVLPRTFNVPVGKARACFDAAPGDLAYRDPTGEIGKPWYTVPGVQNEWGRLATRWHPMDALVYPDLALGLEVYCGHERQAPLMFAGAFRRITPPFESESY